MASLGRCPSPILPFLQSHNRSAIPRGPIISESQISTSVPPKNVSVSISVSPSNCYSSLLRSCSASSTSSDSTSSTESLTSSPTTTGVFIKGLPDSTTEGRLKKAFSQFGEVVQVKIVIEKKYKQPLGSAFVWFASKESALSAVKEMNGEFLDGRYILVKIAEPGSSRSRGRVTPYKF